MEEMEVLEEERGGETGVTLREDEVLTDMACGREQKESGRQTQGSTLYSMYLKKKLQVITCADDGK